MAHLRFVRFFDMLYQSILCYQLITSNANEIHTNQHVLSRDVYWLRGCSAGRVVVCILAFVTSYHRSQRYYSCCFLVIDGHSSLRAQLVVVQKVRSTLQDSIATCGCSHVW